MDGLFIVNSAQIYKIKRVMAVQQRLERPHFQPTGQTPHFPTCIYFCKLLSKTFQYVRLFVELYRRRFIKVVQYISARTCYHCNEVNDPSTCTTSVNCGVGKVRTFLLKFLLNVHGIFSSFGRISKSFERISLSFEQIKCSFGRISKSVIL